MDRRFLSDVNRLANERENLLGAQGKQCVGPSVVVAEFDLKHAWSESLHHRANLPTAQSVLRQILHERNHVESFDWI